MNVRRSTRWRTLSIRSCTLRSSLSIARLMFPRRLTCQTAGRTVRAATRDSVDPGAYPSRVSDSGYVRTPTIAGDRIVFVCEDDLWLVGDGGGIARRLTTTEGECTLPRLSPDGALVAFVART